MLEHSSPSMTTWTGLVSTGAFTYTSVTLESDNTSSSIPKPVVYFARISANTVILSGLSLISLRPASSDSICWLRRLKYSLLFTGSAKLRSSGRCRIRRERTDSSNPSSSGRRLYSGGIRKYRLSGLSDKLYMETSMARPPLLCTSYPSRKTALSGGSV